MSNAELGTVVSTMFRSGTNVGGSTSAMHRMAVEKIEAKVAANKRTAERFAGMVLDETSVTFQSVCGEGQQEVFTAAGKFFTTVEVEVL